MNTEVRNLIERAGWTFVQAFLAVFIVSDVNTLQVAGVAGIAAALSVVKTFATDKLAKPE